MKKTITKQQIGKNFSYGIEINDDSGELEKMYFIEINGQKIELDEKEINNRMKNQVSDKIRRQFSDFCLYNKNLEKTLLKTDAILNLLKKM